MSQPAPAYLPVWTGPLRPIHTLGRRLPCPPVVQDPAPCAKAAGLAAAGQTPARRVDSLPVPVDCVRQVGREAKHIWVLAGNCWQAAGPIQLSAALHSEAAVAGGHMWWVAAGARSGLGWLSKLFKKVSNSLPKRAEGWI